MGLGYRIGSTTWAALLYAGSNKFMSITPWNMFGGIGGTLMSVNILANLKKLTVPEQDTDL